MPSHWSRNLRCLFSSRNLFCILNEVKCALANGEPVVALESAVLTHGMPFPHNRTLAHSVESRIRREGAIPATIAILNGKIRIGLSSDEIDEITESCKDDRRLEVSRRDLSFAVRGNSSGIRCGGTTVSATMMIASRTGIQVFATGGIGGVHRDGHFSLDIRADLTELGRTPITVVASGVKSILDIPRTLEYLETQGVCLATYGPTKEFPVFYVAKSAFEAVELVNTHTLLEINSSILIAVPIPSQNVISDVEFLDTAIVQATKEAFDNKSISGNSVTPFMLHRLNQLTDGAALKANVALLENNATIAAQIASNISRLKIPNYPAQMYAATTQDHSGGVVVIGGSNLDITSRLNDLKMSQLELNGAFNAGLIEISVGGVGRNLADALSRLSPAQEMKGPIRLISVLGADQKGRQILEGFPSELDTSLVSILPEEVTASCVVSLDSSGECMYGVADMSIHQRISPTLLCTKNCMTALTSADLIVIDANISRDAMVHIIEISSKFKIPVFFEPTDVLKANRLSLTRSVLYASPNFFELCAMNESFTKANPKHSATNVIHRSVDIGLDLLERSSLKFLLITFGADGILVVRHGSPYDSPVFSIQDESSEIKPNFSAVHYPSLPFSQDIVSVSGAGDCLTAGFIRSLMTGKSQSQAIAAAIQTSKLALGSFAPVPPKLTSGAIDWNTEVSGNRLI